MLGRALICAIATIFCCPIAQPAQTDLNQFAQQYHSRLVGDMPSDVRGLAKSQVHHSYLYTIQGSKILAIEGKSGYIKASFGVDHELNINSWEGVAVSRCPDRTSKRSCIYLLKSEISLVKLAYVEEPAQLLSSMTLTPQYVTAVIRESGSKLMLLDEDQTVWMLVSSPAATSVYKIKISEGNWTHTSVVSNMSGTRLQTPLGFVPSYGDITTDGNNILLLGNSRLEIFKRHSPSENVGHVLLSKPQRMHLRASKVHVSVGVSWDHEASGYYVIGQGNTTSLYYYSRAQADEQYNGYHKRDRSQGDHEVERKSDLEANELERPEYSNRQQCEDRSGSCEQWAAAGECSKKRDYMLTVCPIACNLCNEYIQTALHPKCTDSHHLCSMWAGEGRCAEPASQSYMEQSCPKSCEVCQGQMASTKACRDMNQYCPNWAAAGRCETYKEYMTTNCAASCRVCHSRGGTAPTCKDASEHCKSWAESGKCETRKDYMYPNCPQSCNLCGTGNLKETPECTDHNEFCPVWAAHEMCSLKPAYMGKYCRLSCQLCTPSSFVVADHTQCADTNHSCALWAKYGLCDKPVPVMQACLASCGKCASNISTTPESSAPADCNDNNPFCAQWAEMDFCQTRADYMSQNCKKSCAVCYNPKPASAAINESRHQTSVTCKDHSEQCKKLAAEGKCQVFGAYMSRNCPASCGLCMGVAPQEEITSQAGSNGGVQTPNICRDQSDQCKKFAEEGKCATFQAYMSRYCPVSCRLCSEMVKQKETTSVIPNKTLGTTVSVDGISCKDRNDLCAVWKKARRCNSPSQFMQRNCPESCGFCKDAFPTPSTQTLASECSDANIACASWAVGGRCITNKDFMSRACRKACQFC